MKRFSARAEKRAERQGAKLRIIQELEEFRCQAHLDQPRREPLPYFMVDIPFGGWKPDLQQRPMLVVGRPAPETVVEGLEEPELAEAFSDAT